MNDIYERAIALMGQPEESILFSEFIQALGETPSLLVDRRKCRVFNFSRSGIFVESENSIFTSIFFHIATASVEGGEIQKYSGNLPAGIVSSDDRRAVRDKIGTKPWKSGEVQARTKEEPKHHWDYYQFGPLVITFHFDSTELQMRAVGVNFKADLTKTPTVYPEPATYLFQHCTKTAIAVLDHANQEARMLKHNFIGSEQLLLGLLADKTTIASRALRSKGVNLRNARREVKKIVGSGDDQIGDTIPYTPRAKRSLQLAFQMSQEIGDALVDTEHILLALLDDGGGVAGRVLEVLYVDIEALHQEVHRLMENR